MKSLLRPSPDRKEVGKVDICTACGQRDVDHKNTGECHRCYQRRWRLENPHHNTRTGQRAEQKRRWDREAAKRRQEAA